MNIIYESKEQKELTTDKKDFVSKIAIFWDNIDGAIILIPLIFITGLSKILKKAYQVIIDVLTELRNN